MRAALGILLIVFTMIQGSLEFILGRGDLMTLVSALILIVIGIALILSQGLGGDNSDG